MMKKIVLFICLLILGSAGYCEDCEYTCVEPYDLTSSTSRFFSTITGQRYLSQKIGESLIKKSIKKNIVSGKINANLESYSTKDLKEGKFKSIQITGKDVNIQGIEIKSFSAKTLCRFNYLSQNKSGDVILREDIPLSIKAVVTEENLNNTMKSSDYKRLVDNINSIGGNFNVFQINSTTVKIKDNKMYYIMNYSIPFVRKTKDIVLCADLKVENGELELANTSIIGSSVSIDVNKFSRIINYINPLDFSAKILENKDAKFKVQNIKISDGEVTVEGIVIVLKDKE